MSQYSAFDSRDLAEAGFNLEARRGAFLVKTGFGALMGGAAESGGIDGQAAISYRF